MPQMEDRVTPISGGGDMVARLGLRRPVRREGAERYLFLTLVSFAGNDSVVAFDPTSSDNAGKDATVIR